jgi:gamma-glutamyl hydrolase
MTRIGVLLMVSPRAPIQGGYINRDVKRWLTSAGMTIVPIPATVTPAEAAAYFDYVNGLFLHPGWADQPAYTATINLFLEMATQANRAGEYFPVWGTCQGFQRLVQFFGGHLERLQSLRLTKGTQIHLQVNPSESRLLRYATKQQLRHLRYECEPWFNHEWGLPVASLSSVYRLLSTSHDRAGTEYVSMIEGKDIPFYGVQFHPEKDKGASEWMAAFLASELKKSTHTGFDPNPGLKMTRDICIENGAEEECYRSF